MRQPAFRCGPAERGRARRRCARGPSGGDGYFFFLAGEVSVPRMFDQGSTEISFAVLSVFFSALRYCASTDSAIFAFAFSSSDMALNGLRPFCAKAGCTSNPARAKAEIKSLITIVSPAAFPKNRRLRGLLLALCDEFKAG
ncbi:MAG: hypothetical protein AB7H71_12585 [Alphaproteobacteria bacterium]